MEVVLIFAEYKTDIAVVGKLSRVLKDVTQHLQQAVAVGGERLAMTFGLIYQFQAHTVGINWWHGTQGLVADIKGIGFLYILQQVLGMLISQSQHLVNQRCNLTGVLTDGVSQTLTLLGLKLGIGLHQHLGKAIDDVERGTYLVTHTTDKIGFHLIGCSHLLISAFQFLVLSEQHLLEAAATIDR